MRVRVVSLVVGLLLLAVAGQGIVPLDTASVVRADGRLLFVEPGTGLANEVVVVRWEGFRPTLPDGTNAVVVLQCAAEPVTLDDCFNGEPYPALDEGTRQVGRTGSDGTGSVEFEVRPATQLPSLGCTASVPCSILAYENDGVPPPEGGLPLTAVTVPLEFAKSTADCPPVFDFDLRSDGSASAAPAMYQWAAERCDGDDAIVLDYSETSSDTGREDFLAGLIDFGVTARPATEEELALHPDHQEYDYVPLAMSAVAVVLNMRDPFTGNRLTDVTLSPRLVARLVTDSSIDSFFTDPELRLLNPGVRFPSVGASAPLLRAERNEDTWLSTSWIAADPEAAAFLAGEDVYGIPVNEAYLGLEYPRPNFENVAQSPSFLPRSGQRTVSLRVFYGVRPAGSIREATGEVGFIGIVDLVAARRLGLPTARIVNGSGEAVLPDEESILAGYRSMEVDESGMLLADVRSEESGAYPLVKIDYAMVPSTPADDVRDSLSAFLRHAVGAAQSRLPDGYVPLPKALRRQTLAQVEQWAAEAAPTTTTTEPATTTTAAPFDFNSGGSSGGGSGSVPTTTTSTVAPTTTEVVETTTTVVETTVVPTEAAPLPPLSAGSGPGTMRGVAALVGVALVGVGIGDGPRALRRASRRRRVGRVPQ
ncbi:MAG: hypothetical protein RJB65_744 [Actinomycetota bacterium]